MTIACWEIVMVGTDLRHEPPLRLTRRGRAVVLALLVLLASLASVVLFTRASSAEQVPSTPSSAVVVRPDDTLWDIAARVDPGRDVRAVVEQVRDLNDLEGHVVRAGESLILPRAQ
jgi:hypothetical protein